MKRSLVTYSMMSLFCECKAAFKFRYIKGLIPLQDKTESLRFGSLIHACLELWHVGTPIEAILDHIEQQLFLPEDKKLKFQALAMMRGYVKKYPSEKFKIVAVEENFCDSICGPGSTLRSKEFDAAGKIDGIVEQDGKLYVLEHKTAGTINDAYLKKIPTDFQIQMYSLYAQKRYKAPINGVIYNILQKSRLSQLKTKGTRSAETDTDFFGRLCRKHESPGMFHREVIPITTTILERTDERIWQITQDILYTLKSNSFYRNSDNCHKWFRPCSYYPICNATDNSGTVEQDLFKYVEPHSELDQKIVTLYEPIHLPSQKTSLGIDLLPKCKKCPARDKKTDMCYGNSWFTAKSEKAISCHLAAETCTFRNEYAPGKVNKLPNRLPKQVQINVESCIAEAEAEKIEGHF